METVQLRHMQKVSTSNKVLGNKEKTHTSKFYFPQKRRKNFFTGSCGRIRNNWKFNIDLKYKEPVTPKNFTGSNTLYNTRKGNSYFFLMWLTFVTGKYTPIILVSIVEQEKTIPLIVIEKILTLNIKFHVVLLTFL